MKIFYDDNGKVTGYVSGAYSEIEENISIPGSNELIASEDIKLRIEDVTDPLTYEAIKVEGGEVVELSKKDIEKQETAKKDQIKVMEEITKNNPQTTTVPTIEELQAQINDLKSIIQDRKPTPDKTA